MKDFRKRAALAAAREAAGSTESGTESAPPASSLVVPRDGLIAERFRVHEKLGEGAFGLVYAATDLRDGRQVALKALREARAESLGAFKREFRTLQDLRHPNLVVLDELFCVDEKWFFTMELLDGSDLITHIREPGVAGAALEERFRLAFSQLLAGLEVLHEAGLVHRDMKPSNVLVTRAGRVVILDFGLVADAVPAEARATHALVGTPAYMSPEQASFRRVDTRADLYAAGVMMFEALTGRLPFTGDSSIVISQKCMRDAPLASDVASVSRPLAEIVASLLSRTPEARLGAFEARRALDGLGAASPSSLPGRAGPSMLPRGQFVGRTAELQLLRSAVRSDRERRSVIRVGGASGVGKSTLVRRFLEEEAEKGGVVLRGRCYERESVPFKAFDGLVDAMAQKLGAAAEPVWLDVPPDDFDAVVRMFPVLGGLRPAAAEMVVADDLHDMRRRAFEALFQLLVKVSDGAPLTLWLDDVQWADADSATLLATLLGHDWPSKFNVILSYRLPEAVHGPFLSGLDASPLERTAQVQVQLEQLPETDARLLAEHLLTGAESAACVPVVVREAGGNPLFIRVLAAYLSERSGEATELLAAGNISFDAVILDGVKRLPEGARRVLEVISVARTPLSQRVCFQAANVAEDAHSLVGSLRAAQLARTLPGPSGNVIMTHHDRIAETVMGRLTASELRAIHRAIVSALELDEATDPEVLVVHYSGAGDVERAGEHALSAARAAASSLAFERAARLFALAITLRSPAEGERVELETARGDALANAGRSADAATAYLRAAEGATGPRALDLRRRAGDQFLRGGHVDAGFATLAGVLESIGVRMPTTPRAALLSLVLNRGRLLLRGFDFRPRTEGSIDERTLSCVDIFYSATLAAGMIDPIRCVELQSRHILFALRAGEPYRVARALCVHAGHAASDGASKGPFFERVLRLAKSQAIACGQPLAIGLSALAEGTGSFMLGDTRRAVDACGRAEVIFRDQCPGSTWEVTTCRAFSNLSLTMRGDLVRVRSAVAESRRHAIERGDRYEAWLEVSSWSVLASLTAGNDPDEWRRAIRDAISRWPTSVFTVQHHWESIAGLLIDLYTGDGARALERIPEMAAGHQRSLLFRLQLVRIVFRWLHANCLLSTGSKSGVQAARRIARSIRKDPGHRWSLPVSTLLRAGVAWGEGKQGESIHWLGRAVAELDGAELTLLAECARRRLGQLIGGDEGRLLVGRSEAFMRAQGVVEPGSLTRALVPGYDPFDG